MAVKEFHTHVEIDGTRYGKGLIPRNYHSHPSGYLAAAPSYPASLLIDEAEWPERLAEQKAKKSSLWYLRESYYDMLKSLDQNGFGLSHTADTEVLTEKGWVQWPDYNKTDLLATVNPHTHLMEFQAPLEWHGDPYDGEMYHSTNRRLDFGVTNYHRMYVRRWNEAKRTLDDRYSFVSMKDLGWYAGFLHAPRGFLGTELVELEIVGDRRYDGDDLIALLSLVCSDGYAGSSEKTWNKVSFCCFHPKRYPMVAALAERVGFREQPTRKGVWSREDAGALANWIRANCYHSSELGAWNKKVPDLIKVSSMRQISHFLKFFGDKDHNREDRPFLGNRSVQASVFYSTSKRMIDDLQELHLRISKRGTICHNDPRVVKFALEGKEPYASQIRESWTLVISGTNRLCIDRKKHIETDRYKGLVYCATVPNGTLVTRRNGSVLVSGNCWAFSSTKASMYSRILAGLAPLRYSAYWVAGKVKNWRDEGGWGAESLTFIGQYGAPVESMCPTYKQSNDNATTQANAALHRSTKWWDGTESRDMNRKIMVSSFLLDLPNVLDYNWLGHSMAGCYLDSINPLVVYTDNSWNEIDQFGPKGTYKLTEDKAIPDNIVVNGVVEASRV